jgi:hypothetical protein
LETIVIQTRCSRSGKLARAIFTRPDPRSTFRLDGVRAGSSVSASLSGLPALQGGRPDADTPIRVYVTGRELDAATVNWAGFVCPHCAGTRPARSILKCGRCGQLVCSATYKVGDDGSYSFQCACGHIGRGTRIGRIDSFDIERGTTPAAPALPAPGKGILGAARRLLPGGKRD